MSLQDLILLQNKCEELEATITEQAAKLWEQREKLKIAFEALELCRDRSDQEVHDIAKEALFKITGGGL